MLLKISLKALILLDKIKTKSFKSFKSINNLLKETSIKKKRY
ncbi:MAG: hypothetical protein ACRC5T_04545 [Cetobacterium sp.]